MNNPVSKFFVAAVFIYVLMISAVWADRVLIDDPVQTVSVSNNFSCYQPAQITVDTVRPELYEQTNQLQTLSDSVRAMLSFECPQLSSIKLTGLIRGLDEVVYQGELSRNNNWLVKQIAAIDNDLYSQAPISDQQNQTTKRYDDELTHGQLQVIGIHLGMTVDQVSEIVSQTFSVEPTYDATKGLMTMNSGRCVDDVQINAKCMQAWFSDNRVPRLERFELTQVVEGNLKRVNDLLVDKYGNPTETTSNPNSDKTRHVWRAINQTDNNSQIEEVDAIVSAHATDLIITEISLYSTNMSAEPENDQYADIDLKL